MVTAKQLSKKKKKENYSLIFSVSLEMRINYRWMGVLLTDFSHVQMNARICGTAQVEDIRSSLSLASNYRK